MRALALAASAAAVFACAASAAGPNVDEDAFRYVRPLQRAGMALAVFEPDARLYAHAAPGLSDLRVVTPSGEQVPWRPYPESAEPVQEPLAVLYSGTRGDKAVALFDTAVPRRTLDEIELDVRGSAFVGRAEVLGSDDRETFTKLSTTVIYDVSGASRARSTTVVFPAADVRYYLVRASNISAIVGGSATDVARGRPPVARTLRRANVVQRPRATLVTLDLGFRRVPVDRLRITATTPVYDRAVEIQESNDRLVWSWTTSGRTSRLPDSVAQELDASTSSRFIRVRIANGDDEPLTGIRVSALADSRAILVRGGDPGPLRLLYGDRSLAPPQYDFELLPTAALGLASARPATLGREVRNPASLPAADVRSFFERHTWLVSALLGLAALGIAAAGLIAALKPRPPTRGDASPG